MKVLTAKKLHINPSSILSFAIIIFILVILCFPALFLDSSLNAITVFSLKILPCIFPFILLTKLLTKFDLIEKLSIKICKITSKIFHTSGESSYIFLMSMLCGYPISAVLTKNLFAANKIDSYEASRISSFTILSSPSFILINIGFGMLNYQLLGVLIFIPHLLGSFLNGLIWRSYGIKNKKNNEPVNYYKNNKKIKYDVLLNDTFAETVSSVLQVASYIIIFYIFTDFIIQTKLVNLLINSFQNLLVSINISPNFASGIFMGLIETSKGAAYIALYSGSNYFFTGLILTLLISFGSLSMHIQNFTLLKKCGVKLRVYLLQRITHAIISVVLFILLGLIFL